MSITSPYYNYIQKIEEKEYYNYVLKLVQEKKHMDIINFITKWNDKDINYIIISDKDIILDILINNDSNYYGFLLNNKIHLLIIDIVNISEQDNFILDDKIIDCMIQQMDRELNNVVYRPDISIYNSLKFIYKELLTDFIIFGNIKLIKFYESNFKSFYNNMIKYNLRIYYYKMKNIKLLQNFIDKNLLFINLLDFENIIRKNKFHILNTIFNNISSVNFNIHFITIREYKKIEDGLIAIASKNKDKSCYNYLTEYINNIYSSNNSTTTNNKKIIKLLFDKDFKFAHNVVNKVRYVKSNIIETVKIILDYKYVNNVNKFTQITGLIAKNCFNIDEKFMNDLIIDNNIELLKYIIKQNYISSNFIINYVKIINRMLKSQELNISNSCLKYLLYILNLGYIIKYIKSEKNFEYFDINYITEILFNDGLFSYKICKNVFSCLDNVVLFNFITMYNVNEEFNIYRKIKQTDINNKHFYNLIKKDKKSLYFNKFYNEKFKANFKVGEQFHKLQIYVKYNYFKCSVDFSFFRVNNIKPIIDYDIEYCQELINNDKLLIYLLHFHNNLANDYYYKILSKIMEHNILNKNNENLYAIINNPENNLYFNTLSILTDGINLFLKVKINVSSYFDSIMKNYIMEIIKNDDSISLCKIINKTNFDYFKKYIIFNKIDLDKFNCVNCLNYLSFYGDLKIKFYITDSCPICLNNKEQNDNMQFMYNLNCGHGICNDCYLYSKNKLNKCVMCKANITTFINHS